jgi:hypothetical protein
MRDENRFRFTGENTILMIRRFLVLALFVIVYAGCTPKYQRFISNYQFSNPRGVPDYSNFNYWAAHPDKYDPSDSIPAAIKKFYKTDTTSDVFFIHPTTFTDAADEKWNAEIDDASLNAKTDYSTILFQGSVFNESRVFAPRYRQANLKAYFTADSIQAGKAFDLAYEDVRTAFQYYLDHFNHGRPIIIAAHSQGSTHAVRLLQEYFDHKPLADKLIVAYVIGMNIPLASFTELKPCTDSAATGCFCGWRTFRRGHEPYFAEKYKTSVVTNPLTWNLTEEYAGNHLNQGAVLRNFNKLYENATDAQIHGYILWSDRPKFPGSFLYRANNYHIGDINLFYMNIRNNVRARISSYRQLRSN